MSSAKPSPYNPSSPINRLRAFVSSHGNTQLSQLWSDVEQTISDAVLKLREQNSTISALESEIAKRDSLLKEKEKRGRLPLLTISRKANGDLDLRVVTRHVEFTVLKEIPSVILDLDVLEKIAEEQHYDEESDRRRPDEGLHEDVQNGDGV